MAELEMDVKHPFVALTSYSVAYTVLREFFFFANGTRTDFRLICVNEATFVLCVVLK